MGKEKYVKSVLEFLGKTHVASSRDIKLIVNRPKLKKSYSHLLIHNLIRGGKIRKVVKGFYTSREDPTVAVFCFKPAYIGLQDALSVHGLWEQESNVVIITSRKVRTGLRRVMSSNVIIHRIRPRYLFGFDYVKSGDMFVPVSNPEKTLIDFFYFREPLDKQTLENFKSRIDVKKMNTYLRRYPKRFRERLEQIW